MNADFQLLCNLLFTDHPLIWYYTVCEKRQMWTVGMGSKPHNRK